jgi:hypothetical protein
MTTLPHRGAVSAEQRPHFPRWRLWRRTYQHTETRLGSLPLLLLTPIFAATLAAFLATSQPPEIVRNGVVIGPSSSTNLVLAVGGGLGGVALAAVGTFLVLLALYLWLGDGSWSAHNWGSRPEGASGPESFGTLTLACKVTPRLSPTDLGDYECWIRTPSREVWEILDGSYTSGGRGGISAMFAHLVDGEHHVRWYATRGRTKHVELARATIVVDRARLYR